MEKRTYMGGGTGSAASTKKVTINELRNIVRQIIKEEVDNPTPQMIKKAWGGLEFQLDFNEIMNKYDLIEFGVVKNASYYGVKVGSHKSMEREKLKNIVNSALAEMKNKFKFPNKLVLLNNKKEYAPELNDFVIGVELA